MFRTVEEFLEEFEKAFRKYRLEYRVEGSSADRELMDLNSLGYRILGYDTMAFELYDKKKEIMERVSKEIPYLG